MGKFNFMAPVVSVVLFFGLGVFSVSAQEPAPSGAESAPASVSGAAGVSIRLVDIPESRVDDPRARAYIIDHLNPGQEIQRTIEISNNEPEPQKVDLYAGPATLDQGTFNGLERGESNDLSSWTSLEKNEVVVDPGQKEQIKMTLKVPEGTSSGERYGVIWASVTGAKIEDIPGGAVGVSRSGIRMYVSIGPGGEPATDYQITGLTPARDDQGKAQLKATVKNVGGRALDLRGELMLTNGPGKTSAGPFSISLRGNSIAPGQSADLAISLDDVSNGPWDATVKVFSGTNERSATATITFPEKGEGTEVSTVNRLAWEWILAGVAVLVALTIIFILLYRRSRERKKSVTVERKH